MRISLPAALSAVLVLILLGASAYAEQSPPVYEADIHPLFVQKCGKCHSQKVQKGGLDLSTMAGIQHGGESGESAVSDTVDGSMLWLMIDGGGMPPEEEPQLTKAELDLIRRWIAAGAPSEQPVVTEQKLTQHDILPIVLLRCTACHGPQLKRGKLDMRTPASMLAGGESGPAIVPGDPDNSLAIQRIESEACPPREQLLKYFVKRPSSAEVETLRKWIAAGAPVSDAPPDVATTEPDPLVSDEDRQHWAFQPPHVDSKMRSLDAFVEQKLEEHALTFSPEADRDTLIRRAYLDLLGLPPSVDEWRRWHASDDPDWYARMIDHLLASPHYGERWGRYWLDLAGYADSEGGVSADPLRDVAWKYRDYVIESFNDDKPYDEFLMEQLAGDELIDYENASVITEEIVENLVATGFLRMGIDQTGSRTMNFVPERLGVISDAIAVVSSSVMGITMECARCHSHKYDPIPHRDYYRFKAIFQGALDEHDWLSFKTRSLKVATLDHRQRVADVNPPLEKKLRSLESQLRKAQSELQLALLRHHEPDQSEADNQATLKALRVADNNRTLKQRTLVEKLQRAEIAPDDEQSQAVLETRRQIASLEEQIRLTRDKLVPSLEIRALWDQGRPSPTYILRGGEYNKPGDYVGPGVPSVLTDGHTPFAAEPPFPDGTDKTGRRLAFARWLTQPDHPLTARVMVNRIWYHHFGTGLVKTLENFGNQGARPTHPELLDWLAIQFVERGWSIKEMHRLIMNSRTYRQSSRVTAEQMQHDPTNQWLSRAPLRRMNAEALRDSLLFVSGQLDPVPGGPPDPVTVDRDGLVSVLPTSTGKWRRSVYAQYRRTEIPSMMETFDYPEMGPNCVSRSVSTVSLQPLMLMNNTHIHNLAAALAERVERQLEEQGKTGREATVSTVYHVALSRDPSEQEQRLGVQALQQLEADWDGSRPDALETYCHTILNSAAFSYID